ncbi:MAG: hypothetical protein EHM28_08465 [Spirochaetaceae bacterium]|nr:MAG: hypothetical protein EHM28_08465 [Spirochaetaceae bacterium]
MIVPMKKAILIVLEAEREESLKELGKLGVLHIDAVSRESADFEKLSREHDLVVRAHSILAADKKKAKKAKQSAGMGAGLAAAMEIARAVSELDEQIAGLKTEKDHIQAELGRCMVWGLIEPKNIHALEENGIRITLTELSKKEYEAMSPDAHSFVIKKEKGSIFTVIVSFMPTAQIPGKVFGLPENGTLELEKQIALRKRVMQEKQKELEKYLVYQNALESAESALALSMRFEEVRHGMNAAGSVSHVTGFVPETSVETLKAGARTHGWGLAFEDPAPEDDVPTLLKNAAPVRMVKPIFDFLGTVPGYREMDASFIFLAFFSIFYAMLIGDAGYGCLFLLFTLLGRIFYRKMNWQIFGLLLVTSLATIVWGAVTNTWFSMKAIAESPIVKWAFIPALSADNTKFLMFICFVIGLVHLSLAHVIGIFRNLKSFKAISEIGRLGILWGIFFLILNLVLQEPLNPIAIYLVLGGIGLVVLFEQQTGGNFIKGVGMGIAGLFLTFLSVASTFADIVSYVRLFAVSLAGAKIAETFNGMASSISEGMAVPVAGVVLSALVLFLGHALNIVLSLIGVLVHGVRLNILEFSGHLGMEWSGRMYTPFTYAENAQIGKEKS